MSAHGRIGASADAIEFLTTQHRELEQLWSQLQALHATRSDEQAQLSEEIVKMLSQHDAIETQLLYPELRSAGGDEGKRLSEHSLDEHQQVRELLTAVDGEDIRDESIFSTMQQCMSAVLGHVEEEEHRIFPLLREHAEATRLMDLGQQMESMMSMAPTHPHPTTPDSKVGATVAGAVSGVMDKARDAMRRAGQN